MSAIRQVEWWRSELAAARPWTPTPEAAGKTEDACSNMPFVALMAFTFVLLLAPQGFLPALAPLRLGLLTAAVGITTYLIDRFLHRQPIMKLDREMAATACLVLWAILTLPLSYWPGGSLSLLLEAYFKTLAVFWLLANVVSTLPRLRAVAWGLSLMAVPLAASGVKGYVSGRFIGGGPVKRILAYDAPLTQNPNDLALMLNLILPLALALALCDGRPTRRMALAAIVALNAVAVILTFSRAGFITLTATFVIYGIKLLRRPERGWVIAALVVALACSPLLPSGYRERLSTITDIHSDPTGSAQERWTDTMAALKFVARNPIVGAGVGMNILALNDMRGPAWKEVHNVYLEYAVDLGLPGLVLFLVILIGCVRATVSVMRRSKGAPALREMFLLAEGIQVSLFAFAVAGFFHPVAYHHYFYYVAGLALAARAACERLSGQES
jgi:O-antigen ligase